MQLVSRGFKSVANLSKQPQAADRVSVQDPVISCARPIRRVALKVIPLATAPAVAWGGCVRYYGKTMWMVEDGSHRSNARSRGAGFAVAAHAAWCGWKNTAAAAEFAKGTDDLYRMTLFPPSC